MLRGVYASEEFERKFAIVVEKTIADFSNDLKFSTCFTTIANNCNAFLNDIKQDQRYIDKRTTRSKYTEKAREIYQSL